jgi:uncharacterized protein (DUF58 family)
VIKLGRSFWWILLLIGVSFIVARLPGLGDNPIYIRLTIALIIVLGANGLWAVLSIIGVDLHRSTRTTRKQVGEIFTENFEVINRSIIPKVWLKVSDQAELPGGSGSKVLTWVGSRQSRTYVAYSLLQKRGWFQLGSSQIETGDIFGLFLIRKNFVSKTRLLVIPYTVPINEFPAPFGVLPGGRALRQKTLEVTPYAAGVREYVPGDPLKRIHWPTSARKQKIIVKEFEKDPLAEVWIFLDARASVQVHKEEIKEKSLTDFWWMREKRQFRLPPHTEEYAVTIAASIGKYYINQKREVGLVAAGQSYTILPAERGERQLGKILETLAVLRAEGEMPLLGLISSQLGHLARGSTVILISPSADDNILTIVMELIQRGLMPVVILIDQESFGGKQNTQWLHSKLTNRGILTFVINEGDNIKVILETPNLGFDERIIFRGI